MKGMKAHGWAGLAVALGSLVLVFFTQSWYLIGIFLGGAFFLLEALDYKLTGYSLLEDKASKVFLLGFGGALAGTIIEYLGTMILHTWRYNIFYMSTVVPITSSIVLYSFDPAAIFIIGLAWVILAGVFYEIYRVTLHFLNKLPKPSTRKTRELMPVAGAIGALLIAVPIVFRATSHTIFFDHLMYIVGAWLFFEYIAFKRAHNTFLGQALQGNWPPLAAAAISAVPYLLAEVINAESGAWTLNPVFFGPKLVIPVLLFVTIPLLCVSLFSIYNALVNDKKIWET